MGRGACSEPEVRDAAARRAHHNKMRWARFAPALTHRRQSFAHPTVRHAGRRLGTLNFCGEEGTYGVREQAIGRVLAGLLVPPLLKAVGG